MLGIGIGIGILNQTNAGNNQGMLLANATGTYSWSGIYDGEVFEGTEMIIAGSSLALYFSDYSLLTELDLSNNHLTQESIDSILAKIVLSGASNGTIDISGNDNPSISTHSDILETRGWLIIGLGRKTNIDGSDWALSGAASAGSTNLSAITGGTHVGSFDVPIISESTGYIKGGDNAALTFRVDPTNLPLQASDDTEYWVRFWFYAERNATELAADGTNFRIHTVSVSGSTKLTTTFYLRNTDVSQGFGLSVDEFLTGGSRTGLFGASGSGAGPLVPFNKWVEASIHLVKDASLGYYELYINRTLVSSHSGLPTLGLGISDLGSDWLVNLAGVNGITWRISGPIISTSGLPRNTPLCSELVEVDGWATKAFPATYLSLDYGGIFWRSEGNAIISTDSYNDTAEPGRNRFIISGAAGNYATIISKQNVGVLPYNENQWATILFPMIYVPTGTLQICIGDYVIEIANGYLRQNDIDIVEWNTTGRYFIAIHFSLSGAVHYSLHNLSGVVSSQNFWSGTLQNWTPKSIGRITYKAVLGTTSMECDGVLVYKWLPIIGHDSLSATYADSVTPNMARANHVAQRLLSGAELYMVPGGNYPFLSSGMPRAYNTAIIGRAGETRAHFTTNVLPYMNYSRGIVLLGIDGSSVNDMSSIDDDSGVAASVVTNLTNWLTTAVSSLTANGNKVWLTTMIERVQGTTWTATERQAMLDFNSNIRILAAANPNLPFSDPAVDIIDPSVLFSSDDDTHFNTSGDIIVAGVMADSHP